MKISAIIPAGGKGLRSGLKIPKQFVKIKGKELIAYTLELFQKNKRVNEIIIAAPEEYFPLLERIKKTYKFSKIKLLVKGGTERQHSVYNALTAGEFEKDDLIIVHDAARPLLSKFLLNSVLDTAIKKGNAVLAVKARDTLACGDGVITSYIDRGKIYYLQTPQIFRYKSLRKAFESAYADKFVATDETMLVNRTAEKVNIVEGSHLNFKITNPEDFKLFRKLVSETGRIKV